MISKKEWDTGFESFSPSLFSIKLDRIWNCWHKKKIDAARGGNRPDRPIEAYGLAYLRLRRLACLLKKLGSDFLKNLFS